jgi:hypothetical protein
MGMNLQRNSEHKPDLAVAEWIGAPFGFDCSNQRKRGQGPSSSYNDRSKHEGVPYHNGWINPKSKWIGAPRSSSGAQSRQARATRVQKQSAEPTSGRRLGACVRRRGQEHGLWPGCAKGDGGASGRGGTSPGDAGSSGRQWMMGRKNL